MKVTVQSVADRAQVSIGTVSRVLNDDPSVSPELSERVRSSVDALGYQPLRKRKTSHSEQGLKGKSVALLTLGMDASLAQLPVVTAAIDGIREGIFDAGANLQLVDVPDPSVPPDWLKRVDCDAWLIKGAMQGDLIKATHRKLLDRLESSPCVWFHGRPRGATGSGVGVNDWAVGEIAAQHLFDKGHRKVAFLSPKNDQLLLKRRQHGFVSRCDDLGMEVGLHSRNLQAWSFPLERPRSLAAVKSLLDSALGGGRKPTAIFTPADSIAVLLYRALAERGLKMGVDISLVSANAEEGLIGSLFPALTTVDIHSRRIGKEAVTLLESSLKGRDDFAARDVQIEPDLAVAQSIAELP